MATLLGSRWHRDSDFHMHPWHGMFSLVMTLIFSMLLVLLLVSMAR